MAAVTNTRRSPRRRRTMRSATKARNASCVMWGTSWLNAVICAGAMVSGRIDVAPLAPTNTGESGAARSPGVMRIDATWPRKASAAAVRAWPLSSADRAASNNGVDNAYVAASRWLARMSASPAASHSSTVKDGVSPAPGGCSLGMEAHRKCLNGNMLQGRSPEHNAGQTRRRPAIRSPASTAGAERVPTTVTGRHNSLPSKSFAIPGDDMDIGK